MPASSVDILCPTFFVVAVFNGMNYGLIAQQKHGNATLFRCTMCGDATCSHLELFHEWCEENEVHDLEANSTEETPRYSAISNNKIPYPLPEALKLLHDGYECGKCQFPKNLVPKFVPELCCQHGNQFHSRDPVTHNWVSSSTVAIYKYSTTITDSLRGIYYRSVFSKCDCRQQYDGQEDLQFNLDKHHLFYYDLLFDYLHQMIKGQLLLSRMLELQHAPTLIPAPKIKQVRAAWNAFARLIDQN